MAISAGERSSISRVLASAMRRCRRSCGYPSARERKDPLLDSPSITRAEGEVKNSRTRERRVLLSYVGENGA